MDCVTELPPSGDKGYNSCLLIVDRYSKITILLPCHKDDTAMDKSLILWSRAYHPQTNGLAERMIQTLEDMIRRFCAYGLDFKYSNGFTHDWCTVMRALELAYKKSVHSSAGQTPIMSEKGCNLRLPEYTLRRDLIEIHPTSSSFKIILDKVKHHEEQIMNAAFDYAKQKWDKSHKVPDFKVGSLVLVSSLNFDNIKAPKEIKGSYVGPFVIVALHETNAFQVELSADKELFPLRNPTPLTVPPLEQSEDKKINKLIKERRIRGKNQREYLVRYRNPVHEHEWLAESEIPDLDKLLRRFRHQRRPQA
ncbi:hypothetical protein O181_048824 [Austropuccinia psidii MF-1]|uniref:Integrase catalytic domain-containing protein n=1 Tax=Austropuccinia psidii MF-1 TaxID=1389203 RepID=A0A9Q3HN91_9BASI|nr:hypothetical protein [Austropuccinia psidii MF-1]